MRPRTWFSSLALLAPLVWLFRHALFENECFAFRDSAHYYFPLYKYIQTRWASGLPLWNPLDGIGQPLLGDPTAAVLYPGKLLFLLPLPFATCFVVYIVAHLWLAGLGAQFFARRCNVSFVGAVVAGLAYELSGQVLFQYCNPIFVIGAAWLPWALGFLVVAIKRQEWRAWTLCSISISMMVLGGDPQMAYQVVILGSLLAVTGWYSATADFTFTRTMRVVVSAAVFAGLLSAAQILPTLQWSQQSDRSLRNTPRSIAEWSIDKLSGKQANEPPGTESDESIGNAIAPPLTGMWSREAADGHARKVYDFSVGPWRWIELFWPNVTGQPFPQNHRWLTALSGESRFWTPSLYMGLLPLMLALRTGMKHRSSLWVRWLLLATILCCIAAIGQHGIGWLENEVRFQLDGTNFERSKLLPGAGGLYWLMNCILPGFVNFRYPAKLWTIAALGMGILAGKSWPWLFSVQSWRRQKRYFLVWIGINALLACVVFLFASRIGDWAASVRPSPLFGPLETSQLARGVAFSFAHSAIIAAFAWVVLAMSRELNWSRVSQSILLLVVAVDLVIAQAGMIRTVPASMWSVDRDASDTTSEASRSSLANQTLYRCEPLRTYPRSWRNMSSPSRFHELQESDFQTLMPKHHLLHGARALRSTVPMSSADYDVLWEVGLIAGHDAGEQNYRVPPNEFLELLGASHWFVPSGDVEPDDALIVVDDSHDVVQHLINQRSLPRAWLVQDWQVLTGKTPQTRKELLRRTRSVLFDEQGQIRDFRQVAVVEKPGLPTSKTPSDTLPNEPTNTTAVLTAAPAECAITKDTPERIRIDVNPQTPSLLVLSDQFFPGWDVFVGNESSKLEARECLRVNRVMRGVILSPGDTRVEFRYRPGSVYWGLAISGSMWAGLLVICFRQFTARVKQQFGAASDR